MREGVRDPRATALPEHPLVSVLVPAFNHERYVTATLSSIVDDGYPNTEIIVLDDGSTDETALRIQRWVAEHRHRVRSGIHFVSRDNRGLTRTLNEMLGMARGEFATPLASDDLLLPGGIRKRVEYLQQRPHLKAVFGDCTVVGGDGELLYGSGLFELYSAKRTRLRNQLAEEIIANWTVPGPVLLFRLEDVFAIGGWDERLLIEDWDLYLRLVSRGWLGFLDEKVAAYRLHGANSNWTQRYVHRTPADSRLAVRSSIHAFRGRQRAILFLKYLWFSALCERRGSRGRQLVWRAIAVPVGLSVRAAIAVLRRLPRGPAPSSPQTR